MAAYGFEFGYRRALPVFAAISWTATILFFITRYSARVSSGTIVAPEAAIAGTVFLAYFGTWIASWKFKRLRDLMISASIIYFTFVAFFLCAEGVFALFPPLVPKPLARMNPDLGAVQTDKLSMVEYLADSPWVKFRANATIRSQGDRGKDFFYTWDTDALGFKNSFKELPKNVDVLAVGDSFVEGMGMPIDRTWTAKLNASGYLTYNAGVQGYAPTQIAGALRKFGPILKPKIVIFGYTPGFESRELTFLHRANYSTQMEFTGGIGAIANTDKAKSAAYLREIRSEYRHFLFANAALDLLELSLSRIGMPRTEDRVNITSEMYQAGGQVFRDLYQAAPAEYNLPRASKFDPTSVDFVKTKEAIVDARAAAKELGADFILLVFLNRSFAYYKEIFNTDPEPEFYEIKLRKSLKAFCTENGISMLDIAEPVIKYVQTVALNPDFREQQLPFFKIDGHMNEVGQVLITEEVKKYLAQQGIAARETSSPPSRLR